MQAILMGMMVLILYGVQDVTRRRLRRRDVLKRLKSVEVEREEA